MKKVNYLFSVVLHLVLILISAFVFINKQPQVVTLGYGNVEFSTFVKNNFARKNKTKKYKIKNEGNGEAIDKTENKVSVPSLKNKNLSSYLNGKFSIDFNGKRKRAIYSYVLPEYPNGVEKEANIVLKFIIQPDGTVANIIPIIKADSRLEIAAINALKNWRFEPLPQQLPQLKQEAIIVFPYRLQ